MADDTNESIMQNKVINEEYKIWKKNAPYLYDTMFRYDLYRQIIVLLTLSLAKLWTGRHSQPSGFEM